MPEASPVSDRKIIIRDTTQAKIRRLHKGDRFDIRPECSLPGVDHKVIEIRGEGMNCLYTRGLQSQVSRTGKCRCRAEFFPPAPKVNKKTKQRILPTNAEFSGRISLPGNTAHNLQLVVKTGENNNIISLCLMFIDAEK